jgi:ABC-2 type transport system ATP-binding protein
MKTTLMGADTAIEIAGLRRSFGTTRALDGLDLHVPAGGVYGVLGPNGAGKTTAIRILATLLRPDGGSARVFGHDVVADADAVRRRISLTGQFSSVDLDLTGIENLMLVARLLGLRGRTARSRSEALLDAFGLVEARDRLVKHYSGGMRRRLDIAASIVESPELMFLDEPTTGLDPRSRLQVWDIVRDLAARGTTVLLTTQYLDEADQLADRIAVVDHGRSIAEGTPAQLKSRLGSGTLFVRLLDPERRSDAAAILLHTLGAPMASDADPAVLRGTVGDAGRAVDGLSALNTAGIVAAEFALGQPTLDEVFLALTGATTSQPHSEAVA